MSYSAEVLADSPLAYYRLGDASGTTMTDSSGNGRHGTYFNSPTLGATGLLLGDSDTAVELSGSLQYMSVPDDNAYDGLSAFTITARIKLTSVTGVRMIVSRDDSTTGGGRSFQFRMNGNKLEFVKIAGGVVTVAGGTSLSTGVEYSVAARFDGSTAKVYVDGVQDGTGTMTGTLGTVTELLRLGASRSSGGTVNFFSGTLDEVALFASALSPTRIAAHHAAALIPPPREGVFSADLPGFSSDLSGLAEQAPRQGVFAADLPGFSSDLEASSGTAVGGVFSAELPSFGSALEGYVDFVPFEPAAVGAGFPLRFSARLSPPLSVDVDDVVPFGRVASSVSEDV
jgi:hypothetical protein